MKKVYSRKFGGGGGEKKEKIVDVTLKISSVNSAAALKSKTTKVT